MVGLFPFPFASDWSRNGPVAHIWQMRQKERSVGRLPEIVFLEKNHRTSQEERTLLSLFILVLNAAL